jgi:hypothetical protein
MKLIGLSFISRKTVFLFVGVFVACVGLFLSSEMSAKEVRRNECVFLVHGLGRTEHSMGVMKRHLKKEGYKVISVSYDSRTLSVDEAVAELRIAVSNELNSVSAPDKIHFVTHSLGGILTRKILESDAPQQLGRVVMLSPPNHGSELPDKLGKIPLYKKVTGPAGMELGTEKDSYPNRLGPVKFSLGVITGDRSLNPLYSGCIPGKDDGKVSVDSAKVDGMADFLVVHSSHTWIMNRKVVRNQVVCFLQNGEFEREKE